MKILFKSLFLILILCFSFSSQAQNDESTWPEYTRNIHHNSSISNKDIPYRLFIPDNYDPKKKYPIVLFLHGAGERGTDNERQLKFKGGRIWAENENQSQYPCFVLAPQCPKDDKWVNVNWALGTYCIDDQPISEPLEMVLNILDTLKAQYSLDTTKFYVTGLSMGGYGTWDIIIRKPNMFKAAIPICGAGDTSNVEVLANMPIWCFHGGDDAVVPVSGSREMVNAINALGKNNRDTLYTEYPGIGHASWKLAYSEENLVSWLFNSEPIECEPKAKKNNEASILAFPNPLKKGQTLCLSHIFTKKTKVMIFNFSGQLVFEDSFENTNIIRLNDLNLNTGIYLLKINDALKLKKIIIY